MLDEGRWEEVPLLLLRKVVPQRPPLLVQVAAMMLDYYDKLYVNWARQSECLKRIDVDCHGLSAPTKALRPMF